MNDRIRAIMTAPAAALLTGPAACDDAALVAAVKPRRRLRQYVAHEVRMTIGGEPIAPRSWATMSESEILAAVAQAIESVPGKVQIASTPGPARPFSWFADNPPRPPEPLGEFRCDGTWRDGAKPIPSPLAQRRFELEVERASRSELGALVDEVVRVENEALAKRREDEAIALAGAPGLDSIGSTLALSRLPHEPDASYRERIETELARLRGGERPAAPTYAPGDRVEVQCMDGTGRVRVQADEQSETRDLVFKPNRVRPGLSRREIYDQWVPDEPPFEVGHAVRTSSGATGRVEDVQRSNVLVRFDHRGRSWFLAEGLHHVIELGDVVRTADGREVMVEGVYAGRPYVTNDAGFPALLDGAVLVRKNPCTTAIHRRAQPLGPGLRDLVASVEIKR